jgi:WD40 repeat protein
MPFLLEPIYPSDQNQPTSFLEAMFSQNQSSQVSQVQKNGDDVLYVLPDFSKSYTQHLLTLANRPDQVLRDIDLTGHTDWVHFATFSPDGQMILTASEDGTARLWNRQGDELVVFKHTECVSSAAFSSDS